MALVQQPLCGGAQDRALVDPFVLEEVLVFGREDRADEERRRALSTVLGAEEFRPLSSSVKVDLGARSDRGKVRDINEDHYLIIRLERDQEVLATSLPSTDLPRRFDEFGYSMVVADGLGGTGAGGLASRVALSTFAHLALHFRQTANLL